MNSITTRVPKIEWNVDLPRHWLNGNASSTHAFNVLSLLFPQGETFFIEVAREVMAEAGDTLDLELRESATAFISQEAAHAHQHRQYNTKLSALGYENICHRWVERLQDTSRRHASSLTRLAIVCGYEHYTAVLGNFILSNPDVLTKAEGRMALVWGWHSAEETEHKSVCFDLYTAVGGGWLRRVTAFIPVTVNFSIMFALLYLHMLKRDGCLSPLLFMRTAFDSIRFFFGTKGVAWHLLRYGTSYLSPWFHPWKQNNRNKLESWLHENREALWSPEYQGTVPSASTI